MTEKEVEDKVEKINEIMQKHGIYALDDYFTEIFMTESHQHLFRVKHQRFFDSEKEAQEILQEILNNLTKNETPTATGQSVAEKQIK